VKLKAVVTDGAPEPVVAAMGSKFLAQRFLNEVVIDILAVEDARNRPAEFYVQFPDRSVFTEDGFGVELRLTGVSRNGRKASQFHNALQQLHEIAMDAIAIALKKSETNPEMHIQLFTVLMLDGDIETSPGSGVYSSVLEHPAELVSARDVPE
jgi:hypothetical protein